MMNLERQLISQKQVILSTIILFLFMLGLRWAFSLDPYSASDQLLSPPAFIPSKENFLLGTDDLGRDVLARLIFGAGNTLGAAIIVVLIALITGSISGLLASVYGGFPNFLVGYVNDLIMSFPGILLTIVFLVLLGPGMSTTIIAVSVVTIPGFIRLMKAVADDEMKKDYILAARTLGLSRFKILRSELLPNCLTPVIIQATFAFSDAILSISALGFLRLGINPPMAEWGGMLADAWQFMESQPWLVIFPGLCIFSTVFAANLLGDTMLKRFNKKREKGI